ncbi:MAG: S-layer homology domain-containing protein [Oscillospiraceae bacterium]|nr:S-layer homology domain-containing protein [Oscillospiraceae bacterium]
MRLCRKQKLIVFMLITITFVFTLLIPSAAIEFTDIENHWAKETIERWVDRDILTGYADGTFRPDRHVTRAELATILQRMLGYPTPDYTISGMNPDDWYYDGVAAFVNYRMLWAPRGEYNVAMTREQAIYLIANAFGITSNRIQPSLHFEDNDNFTPYAMQAAADMHYYGFIGGFPDDTFRPSNNITRAEVLTVLDNMIDFIITTPGIYAFDDNAKILVACNDVAVNLYGEKSIIFVAPFATEDRSPNRRVVIDALEDDDWLVFEIYRTGPIMSFPHNDRFIAFHYQDLNKYIVTHYGFGNKYNQSNGISCEHPDAELVIIAMGAMATYISMNTEDDLAQNRVGKVPTHIWYTPGDSEYLSTHWDINNQEELNQTVLWLLETGDNSRFLAEASLAAAMSEDELALRAGASSTGYMYHQMRDWYNKWGETGIVAWDLFRIAPIAVSAQRANYNYHRVIYEEIGHEYIRMATEILASHFDSWDEAYDNYLDGYAWWSKSDISEERPYENYWHLMRAFYPDVFNDDLLNR